MNAFFHSKQFVIIMACLSGMTALGIDAILPIFPNIIEHYQIPQGSHNQIQQMVFIYMLGFALFQIPFGVLADVWGRKALLLFGMVLYTVAAIGVLFVEDYQSLLLLRFIQGAGLAAPRVLSLTIIRDVVSGREMARLMSFIIMVFLCVPAFAPMIGQLIIIWLPWQAVFVFLFICGVALIIWVSRDLPETLPKNQRMPLKLDKVKRAFGEFLRNKATLVQLVLISLLFATLMTYIGLSEQILQKDTYQLGHWFPLFFALIVLGMVAASLINARFILRVGMKKMIFIALSVSLLVDTILFISILSGDGVVPLWLFMTLMIGHFLGFGLAMPNLNALLLLPYQHIAGTASALSGTITSIAGVFIAQFVSGFFDGSLYAISIGFIIASILLWLGNQYLLRVDLTEN